MKTMRISFVCAGLLSAGLLCQGGGGATGTSITSTTATTEPDSGNLRTFVELVRKDVRAEKAIILAQNIDFTKDEAVDFWPLYSEYELDLSKWYDNRLAMIKSYLDNQDALTDDQARKLADQAFSLEQKRTDLKRSYYKKFSKVVGPKKAARFFQIENQLNAMIDLRLAAALPLIK